MEYAPEHSIVWIAHDGSEAIEHCARDRPDLILMDALATGMNGPEAIRRILARWPCAIVALADDVHARAGRVFEAMSAGALDVIRIPSPSSNGRSADVKAMLGKVETVDRLLGRPGRERRRAAMRRVPDEAPKPERFLVVMGASAGGPAALARILSGLGADFPAAVAVVQHVDASFAEALARWLGRQSALAVRLARDGEEPQPGVVLLAGRASHLVLTAAERWSYQPTPLHCAHQPSVDVFFRSVSRHWKGRAVGVLLSGMGRDGAAGLRVLREAGHLTIAQDRASSAVYGMPRAARELDAASEILALDRIAPRLTNIVMHKAGF